MKPLVSIITVCFNAENTIEDTINSVLSQNYDDIEYIVIDGASTDHSLEVINKFKERIPTIISEPDRGMYDAINKGIRIAKGEIIGILNSDDIYTDKKVIADIVSQFVNLQSDAIYADLNYVDYHNVNQVKRKWHSGNYKRGDFYRGWMPPHPAFFVRKSIYENYGNFNLSLKTAADYELMLRFIHKHEINLSYLPRVIVKMREGGMSNASLKNRLKANREDKRAWEINGLQPRFYTLLLKPLRKLKQFL